MRPRSPLTSRVGLVGLVGLLSMVAIGAVAWVGLGAPRAPRPTWHVMPLATSRPSSSPSPVAASLPARITVTVSTSAPAHRSGFAPGRRSYLAMVSTGHLHPMSLRSRRDALVLVAPHRTRTVASWPVRGRFTGDGLADWSADGSTALVLRTLRHGADVIGVDVPTARTTTVHLSRPVGAAILAPDGSGFLAEMGISSGRSLEAVTWDGVVTTLSTRYSGLLLRGRGDTVVVGGDGYDDTMHTLDYATGRVLDTVGLHGACHPLRWWDATQVLVACRADVALVDTVTGIKQVLVPERGRGDNGHLDVRHLPSGSYVQAAGACGVTFVEHQAADGTLHPVQVPGAVGNVVMVATAGRHLVIQHEVDCGDGRPRSELSLFDPLTQREQPLIEVGADQLIDRVLPFAEVVASPR